MDSGESKGEVKTSRKRKARDLEQKTPLVLSESPLVVSESLAEFFAENKNIAGFDNPGRALYTTVRELVENGLDSAESIGELPLIEVEIEEIERIDDDSETAKDSEKRLDKNSALGIKVEEPNSSLGKKVEEATAAKPMKGASIYKVTCKDNGKGMPHDAIHDIFGRVSFRKKHGVKQTRGRFGLGAKMVSIWSKMSTGLPIEINSRLKNQIYKTSCILDIDIHRNIPNVLSCNEIPEDWNDWHGARITVMIKGDWGTYGSEIVKYMRQMAVITPYAEFRFDYVPADKTDINGRVQLSYPRRSEKMPPVPVEAKYHPSAVDSPLIIERLIGQSQTTLLQFLMREFVSIGKAQAKKLIGKMGPDVTSKTQVNSLTCPQVARMCQLFQQEKFDDPSGNCLSPLGEDDLVLSIFKLMKPEMVASYTAKRARVYQGHPFIVEAAVSLGEDEHLEWGFNVFRFANRVPLLFEKDAADVVTTAIKSIQWRRYHIYKDNKKVGVYVNIVSTKIPFKGIGMEYIGDDISEIADAVKTCLEDCCKQLKPAIVSYNRKSWLDQAATAMARCWEDDPAARPEKKKMHFQRLCEETGITPD